MRLLTLLTGLIISVAMLTSAYAQQKQDAESISGELTQQCAYPKAPSIPNGKNSTKDELLATQTKMKAYLAKGNEFLACLDQVQAGWSEDEQKEKGSFIVMFHNRMVDDMNEVADLFNTSVRAFKGRK
jgi:hypothetical protein